MGISTILDSLSRWDVLMGFCIPPANIAGMATSNAQYPNVLVALLWLTWQKRRSPKKSRRHGRHRATQQPSPPRKIGRAERHRGDSNTLYTAKSVKSLAGIFLNRPQGHHDLGIGADDDAAGGPHPLYEENGPHEPGEQK